MDLELFRNLTLGQYVRRDSVVHNLDPRLKIVLLVLLVTEGFLLKWWPDLLLFGCFILASSVLSGLRVSYVLRGIRSILFLVILTFVFNVLLTPGEEILSLSFLKVTREGLNLGVLMALRLMLIMLATSLLTLTTSPIELTDALERLMKPGRRIGIPAHEIALMLTIALRFIPTLFEQMERIMKAQMARGAEFERGSLLRRARALVSIMVPLFVHAFRHAEELAVAMEARCYRGGEGRTRLKELRFSLRDVVAALITGVILSGLVWVEVLCGISC